MKHLPKTQQDSRFHGNDSCMKRGSIITPFFHVPSQGTSFPRKRESSQNNIFFHGPLIIISGPKYEIRSMIPFFLISKIALKSGTL